MTATLDKLQPPQSLDAEQAVLGSILKDEEAMAVTIGVIDHDSHFYFPKHQMIFRACLALYEKSEPCDITTVANHLQSSGQLEKIGGRVYLVEIVEAVASTSNVEHYAKIVLDKSVGRRLIDTSNEISRTAYEGEMPMDELLDSAEANIFRIAGDRTREGISPFHKIMAEALESIDAIQTGGNWIDSIPTGFEQIDAILQGMRKGNMIVIACRPSMGKSALALNIAENVTETSQAKRAVAIFSIEMSKNEIGMRMLCSRAKVSQQKLRKGRLNHIEQDLLTEAAGYFSLTDILVDDPATLSPLQVRSKARRLKSQYPNLALVIVDYIQLMHATNRTENRQQEITLISRGLKTLAKELDVPVIVCSQLSRAVDQRPDKRPVLADLRESGAIEQDADVVMFIYRPEYYLSDQEKQIPKNHPLIGTAEIIVAKQRNGPTGTAHLIFQKDFARFKNAARTYEEQEAEAVTQNNLPF